MRFALHELSWYCAAQATYQDPGQPEPSGRKRRTSPLTHAGTGAHAPGWKLASGSHPARQFLPVPQKPFSEQHGALSGHWVDLSHDCARWKPEIAPAGVEVAAGAAPQRTAVALEDGVMGTSEP